MDAPHHGGHQSQDDAQSYMDPDDVREYRLHHWLSETAVSARLSQGARADSPVLGFDHIMYADSNKPLPDLPASLSRLRAATSSTVTAGAAPSTANVLAHHRSTSHPQSSSHSQPPSRRPSLGRNSSFPLFAESVPLPLTPPSPVPISSRLHSISSSLSLGSNRNAVYIDSEEVSNRLDSWLLSGNPEFEHEDVEDLDVSEYYATDFERNPDSPQASFTTPPRTQGPPPNTPMTPCYANPDASSSQVYLGKPATSKDEDAATTMNLIDQEDVRATPVPHSRSPGPHLSVSSSSSSSDSAEELATSRTSSGSSPALTQPKPEETLKSKPSLASLSMGIMSPRPSLVSLGLGYQNYGSSPTDSNLLSPPPVTASHWSLTSSVAGDIEKDKKKKDKGPKPKGGTRKRLASFISKLANNGPLKESKDVPSPPMGEEILVPERSFSQASLQDSDLLPPVQLGPRSKPPSLKLAILSKSRSVSNLLSPTLSSKPSLSSLSTPLSPTKSSQHSSTPTPTFATSPISVTSTPGSPVNASFISTRLSLSTSMTTTSTTAASPLMPNTPILGDVPLTVGPGLKNAVSVPALSPAFEGPGLLRRDSSFGWSMNSSYYNGSLPTSPTNGPDEDDDGLDDDAEYYVRDFSLTRSDPLEEERKARLSLIADMLDRDLKSSPRQSESKRSNELPVNESIRKPKPVVKVDTTDVVTNNGTPTSLSHFRKSSSTSRPSITQKRSVSGPSSPISPTTPPPMPSRSGFRSFAARISNSISTPQSPPRSMKDTPDAKRKSIASLMSNGKRKGPKRRLVISGVGDGQGEIEALKEWCASLGEVRSMVKVRSAEGEVIKIGQREGSGHNVWVVDFKKNSVAESVCRLQAKVEIKGAGSVRLSWETAKPKITFGMGRKGWIP